MARSGSRDFTLTKNELMRRAFQCANIYDIGATIPANEMNFASDLLNAMIKHWQAEHINLWNRKEATLFTTLNTYQYSLGSTGTNASESYESTAVSTAASSGTTTLIVDSTSGMTAADNVGIQLDDGTRQWTTIATVDSSTQLTLSAALTDDVAVDNSVVSYTTKITRPLLILNLRWELLSNPGIEIYGETFRRNDYFAVSDKSAAGAPNRWYYDKQLDNGTLYLFQCPDDVGYLIHFSYYEDVEDMDAATNNFDFPLEWTSALMWSLAAELAQAYGMIQELQALTMKSMMLKNSLFEFDYDEEPILIAPAQK